MEQKIYRQGDTLLRQIHEMPFDIKEIKTDDRGRVILAHGEMTGHAHAFRDNNVLGYILNNAFEAFSRKDACPHFIEISGNDAILRHEHISGIKAEHDEIVIPKGIYESAVQVEEVASFLTQVED